MASRSITIDGNISINDISPFEIRRWCLTVVFRYCREDGSWPMILRKPNPIKSHSVHALQLQSAEIVVDISLINPKPNSLTVRLEINLRSSTCFDFPYPCKRKTSRLSGSSHEAWRNAKRTILTRRRRSTFVSSDKAGQSARSRWGGDAWRLAVLVRHCSGLCILLSLSSIFA